MKKEEVMQLFMVAMATSEFKIIKGLIEGLEHYKKALKLWHIEGEKGQQPDPPMAEIIIMLTKFQIIGMSYTDIFKMISEHDDVVNTAMEFHKMLNESKK